MLKNSISNFNIPVIDFDRAVNFYSYLLGYDLQIMEFHNSRLGVFQFDPESGGVGGALIKDENAKPSKEGTIVFLHAGEDLQKSLDRIRKNTVIVSEKSSLGPDMGYFAIIEDTEGNRVGLYSRN